MTVSLQLTPWALPGVLAVLVVLRDAVYLWPRRRERSVPALLSVVALSGLWAAIHVLAVVSGATATKVLLIAAEYVPAMLAPVALLVFTLVHARRRNREWRRDLRRWPLLLLYSVTAVGLVLALRGDRLGLLVRATEIVERGDFVGVMVIAGPAHWALLVVRVVVAVAAAWLLLGGPVGRARALRSRGLVVTAVLLMVVPAAVELGGGPAAYWTNLSSVGFALATAALSVGLLRPRLMGLGPVARTLVLDGLRDPIVVFDGRGTIVDVNQAAERTLGVRAFGDVPLALGTLWASSRNETQGAPDLTLPARREGDESEARTFEVTVTHLEEGEASGRSALLLRDVTERRRIERELRETTTALGSANEELERLANTDPLTGLANRRHFTGMLERETERSARYSRPLSIVLLDLDHFKKVNDTHGHAAGDDVLRAAAAVLKAACRDVDLAARIGGEELALLLPETDSGGAEIVAERVREEIEAGRHRSPEGVRFRVTASIGVASSRGGDGSGEDLLQASDKALYAAKDGGRNRVVVAL